MNTTIRGHDPRVMVSIALLAVLALLALTVRRPPTVPKGRLWPEIPTPSATPRWSNASAKIDAVDRLANGLHDSNDMKMKLVDMETRYS